MKQDSWRFPEGSDPRQLLVPFSKPPDASHAIRRKQAGGHYHEQQARRLTQLTPLLSSLSGGPPRLGQRCAHVVGHGRAAQDEELPAKPLRVSILSPNQEWGI